MSKRIERLAERIKKLEAERRNCRKELRKATAAERQRQRTIRERDETRKNEIIGRIVRKAIDQNEALRDMIAAEMMEGVTQDPEKRLFPEFCVAGEQVNGADGVDDAQGDAGVAGGGADDVDVQRDSGGGDADGVYAPGDPGASGGQ